MRRIATDTKISFCFFLASKTQIVRLAEENMPMEYTWRAIGTAEGELLANKKLDKMRSLHVYTNNKNKRCSICKENTDGHKMRYKMWYCVSSTCNTTGEKCPYWLKLLQCFATDTYSFYEYENHLANVGSPKERVFTLAMKTQSRTMITDGVKPARIRNSLIDQFSMDRSTVPELKTIQNFVYNYKRSTLVNTDFVDDVISLAKESRYSPELDDLIPFLFGYKLDNDGNPVLGDGNDEDPFILAFSTKYMLRQLDRFPGEFVFHMDATFKLTTKEFPLFVCGISDASRHFHCVALFITSQRTHVQYAAALNAISSQLCEVVGRSVNVTYFMGDAEEAQLNGFEVSIGMSTDSDYLMCFFHVVSNVKKRLSGISEQSKQIIFQDIYDLHYSRVVDTGKRSCNCSAYFKYACCVHVLAALRSRNVTIPGCKGSERVFISRRFNRKRDTGEGRDHNGSAGNDQTDRRSDTNRWVRGRGSGRGRGSSRGRRGRRFELDLETNDNEAPVGRPRRVQDALSFD